MKKTIIYIKKYLAIFIMAFVLSGCSNKQQEESIVFGDIDFDAEVQEIVKPKSTITSKNILGTSYLNLLNGGKFSENEEYFFYNIIYDNEHYLIRENKNNNKKEKIHIGNIRNIFIIDNWLYGIKTEKDNTEKMIAMDIDGNNIYESMSFENKVRTMVSNGEKIYFTVDFRDGIKTTFESKIYSCDLDFSNIKILSTGRGNASQLDIVTIENDIIYYCKETFYEGELEKYFSESYDSEIIDASSKHGKFYLLENINYTDYPIIYNNDVYLLDKQTLLSLGIDDNYFLKSLNLKDNILYILLNSEEKSILLLYDLEKTENPIINKIEYNDLKENIYITENYVIIYDGIYYRKLNN